MLRDTPSAVDSPYPAGEVLYVIFAVSVVGNAVEAAVEGDDAKVTSREVAMCV